MAGRDSIPASPYGQTEFNAANTAPWVPERGLSSPSMQPSLRDSHFSSAGQLRNTQVAYEEIPLKATTEGSAFPGDKPSKSRRGWIWLAAILGLLIIAVAVIVPVYFTVIKPKNDSDSSSDSSSDHTTSSTRPTNSRTSSHTPSASSSAPVPQATSGGDGSEVTKADGSTFTYNNAFGGFWVQDPENPFNNDARPNSWTPPLNQTWRWGIDHVQGVNLGGLFVLEPFITPAIFEKWAPAEDEYTLTAAMRAAGGEGLREIEEHYETFITEEDIAEIAGAGLNWLRIPIGFWAIETYDNEPFLERTSWTYFLRVIEWARKYGLRVYLDLHAAPGSQNGLNHSGRRHNIGLLRGNMGLANAQRTLYYLRIFTEFISQPQYRELIPIIGIFNEPESRNSGIGMSVLNSFYLEAYTMIREITGYGEGNGPYIAIGDGFRRATEWTGLIPNPDRLIMDIHPYVAFDEGYRRDLLTETAPDGELGGNWPGIACDRWGTYFNDTKRMLGVTVGGEFSGALNDCGLFMRGVGIYSGHPQCPLYNDWENWTPELREGLYNFVLASFDAIGDFFWWTWKIGPSQAGRVETPFWSYKLGLDNGWIPRDPRVAIGKCAALGRASAPFVGGFAPWQTGAAGNPGVPADYSANYPWPPATMLGVDVDMSLLPRYTTVGTPITLPVPTFTDAPPSATRGFDGWANDADTAPAITPNPVCAYPDQYSGSFAVLPTAACL